MIVKSLLLLLGTLMLITTAYAQVHYVDDTLYLGFYDNAEGKGKQFSSVPSGTKLELIEQGSEYSLVRTEKGTEGWVKTKYLVSTAPASVRIKALDGVVERADALTQEVETLTGENTHLLEQLNTLKNQLRIKTSEAEKKDAVALQQSDVNQQQLNALQAAVDEAMQVLYNVARAPIESTTQAPSPPAPEAAVEPSLTKEEFTLNTAWDYIVYQLRSISFLHYSLIAEATLIGFLLGVLVLDQRIRRQHGGFRPW